MGASRRGRSAKAWVGGAAAAFAFLAGSSAVAAPAAAPKPTPAHEDLDLPLDETVTAPDWVSKPGPDDFSRAYPPLAVLMELPGFAVIECTVATTGLLEHCGVVDEKPLGLGFGRAALEVSASFRMTPMVRDGAAVGGAPVTVPIRFFLGGREDSTPPPVLKPRSIAALALARRITAAVLPDGALNPSLDRIGSRFKPQASEAGEPDHPRERQMLLDAYAKALAAALPSYREQLASAYAADLPEEQLARIAAFVESPAGRAWSGEQLALSTRFVGLVESWEQVRSRTVAAFCSQVTCAPPPKTPPASAKTP